MTFLRDDAQVRAVAEMILNLRRDGVPVTEKQALERARNIVTALRMDWRDWEGRLVCCPYHHAGGNGDRSCGGDETGQ